MNPSATGLGAAAVTLVLLTGGPAAAADPEPRDHVSQDADHGTEHPSDTGATEWPAWAHLDEEHASHGKESGEPAQRPRALVLGSFAAVNGGVLVAAAFLRRRTRGELERRRSARAAALRDS